MREGGNRPNYIRQRISAFMAGVLLVTAVGVLTHMQAQDAKAKETLESITKVVAETSAENPYLILEIVPDTVSVDLPLTDIEGESVNVPVQQNMGMTGYYAGGQEPVVKDLQEHLTVLSDTSLRQGYAQKLLDAVIDPSHAIVNTVSNNATPLFYDGNGYREFREGEEGMTAEELSAGISSGTWILLARDYAGTDGADAEPYVDAAKGTMSPQANSGNFTGSYIPTYRNISEGEDVLAEIKKDHAVLFLNSVSGDSYDGDNFSYDSSASDGAFDPYFLYGTDASDQPSFRAQFAATGGVTGYVAESSTPGVSENAVGTPVYKDDGGSFIYAGEIKEVSGNRIPCDDAGNQLPNEQEYYTVQFSYRAEPVTDGTALYQVSRFCQTTAEEGGQYHLNVSPSASPLVPNTNMTGTVKAKTAATSAGGSGEMTWRNLIYDYTPGCGNFAWDSLVEDGLYQIRGAKIYYTTGLQNREWLKQYSFDRDAGEQCRNLPVEIITKKASEVSTEDVNGAKMILLLSADGAALCVNGGLTSGGVPAFHNYGEDGGSGMVCDISPAVYKQIISRAVQEQIPMIADYGIIEKGEGGTSVAAGIRGSLMYRLIQAMMVQNLEFYYQSIESASDSDIKDDTTDPGTVSPTISANSCHYVNQNVYVYQMKKNTGGASAPVKFINAGFFSEVFSETAVEEGFSEVLIDIENENLYRQTDGGRDLLSTDISQASALRYIIGYAKKREYNMKGTMRILELEPCASYDLSVDSNNGILYRTVESKKEELINQEGTKIELTKMTTAEFIGKIEDLNAKYDMIYIGMNTGLMNIDASGKTKYNDSTMNGLVYCNIGDYIYLKPHYAGLLDQDYIDNDRSKNLKGQSYTNINSTLSRARYSGNDITQEKEHELKNYVEAGYPVVLADDFLKVTSVSGTSTKAVNTATVDNSSHLYQFVDAVKEKQNVFRMENLSPALFNWYVNLAKPTLTMYGNSLAAQSNTVPIVQNPDDGQFYATYEFKITNSGAADSSSRFDVKLYIDINADGKFSKSTEQIQTLSVRSEDGTPVLATEGKYNLNAGELYYANYALSSAHVGVLPWKLEVFQNNNEYRRSGAIGYYEIRKQEKTEVNILQINSAGSTTWNMQQEYANTSGLFYKLLTDESVRYAVDIDTISASAFNAISPSRDFEAYLEYLQEYDMLILGFADCYQEPNATAVSAIEEYIASGRSVLFTHDTTSFINVPSGQFYSQETNGTVSALTSSSAPYWGYQFNRMIRGLVGMDRYNVLGASEDSSNRAFDREKAFVTNSGKSQTLAEIQGFTYPAMNRIAYKGNDGSGQAFPSLRNLNGIDDGDGQYDNEYVTQVNSGQITTYPYKLNERFNVAKTHAQYYQLDFTADDDRDGESDIVVWYCISDSTSKSITGSSGRDMYEMSPNDVRNNYYIYNKGNITYSGVGHSSVITNGSEQEIKLFINTMIAAYRAGLHAPVVNIKENYQDNAREIQNIYVSYDTQLKNMERNAITESGVMDLAEDIYFKASSVSLIQNTANTDHTMSAKLYIEVPEGTPGEETIYLNKDPVNVLELPMTGSSPYYDDALYYRDEATGLEVKADPKNLLSGQTYKTKVPVYYLGANNALWNDTAASATALNTRRIFIVATDSVYNRRTGLPTTLSGSDTASLIRVQVFDLD